MLYAISSYHIRIFFTYFNWLIFITVNRSTARYSDTFKRFGILWNISKNIFSPKKSIVTQLNYNSLNIYFQYIGQVRRMPAKIRNLLDIPCIKCPYLRDYSHLKKKHGNTPSPLLNVQTHYPSIIEYVYQIYVMPGNVIRHLFLNMN